MEPQTPNRAVRLGFSPVDLGAGEQTGSPTDEARLAASLGAMVDRLAQAERLSGAVLLARDGRVLLERACGLADRNHRVPNRIDTRFNLGSMNKMFTAVAVAQLVERGRLSYDDTLEQHLGNQWLPRDIARKIRIAHLLTHTSGLGSYFHARFRHASRERFRRVSDYRVLLADDRPAFEPGSAWRYSNNGYILLGAVIEQVSGRDYFDYVRENIYAPAGMTRTDCYDLDEVVEDAAVGYTRCVTATGPRWHNNLFAHVIRGGPAGGGFSTVHDLLRFDQALRGARLVRAESAEALWTPRPELGSPHYGYGFAVSGRADNRIVGHSGTFPGISTRLDMYLDRGYTLAVLANCDQAAEIVSEQVRQWLGATG